MLKLFKKNDPAALLREAVADYELPAFRTSVLSVLRVIRDADTSLEEIASAVETDPGLLVRMLRVVNSAAFGLARSVDSAGHAVALMGRARVESLVLGLAVRDVLPEEPVVGYDQARFWQAAARRATFARWIAGRLHPATQAQSFTAALLQDMAVPILATVRADYGPVLESWQNHGDVALDALEAEAFGWNHADIGSCMARSWGLPRALIDGIGGHHGSEPVAEPAVLLVGHLRESQSEPGLARLTDHAAREFGMDPKELQDVAAEAFDHAQELGQLLR